MTTRIVDTFQAVLPPADGVPDGYHVTTLPPDLLEWFADLLVLRGVPLSYLVPHPDMLPPESIRFFHIDPNFTARLLDGALAAADLGGFDVAFHAPIARALRQQAELMLALRLFPGENPKLLKLPALSGLLMRSDIVRRWPGLLVSAWDDAAKSRPLVIARKDRLASGLLIVVFAGVPQRVEIAEPPEGTRFGAEPKGNTWSIQLRDRAGGFVTDGAGHSLTAPVILEANRVVRIDQLASAAATALVPGGMGPPAPMTSGHLSLCLQQTPFVQVFQGNDEAESGRLRGIRKLLTRKGG